MKTYIKRILYFLVLASIVVACKPEKYERYDNEITVDDIDSMRLIVSSKYLLANEMAELKLWPHAFFDVTMQRWVSNWYEAEVYPDSVYDATVAIKVQDLPDIEYYEHVEGGQDVLLDDIYYNTAYYNANGATAASKKFYAKAGNTYSDTVEVFITQPEAYDNWESYTIPIMFHFLKSDEYSSSYYWGQFTDLSATAKEYVDHLNALFSGALNTKGPHSLDTRIRFELATHDPGGEELESPGVNIVELGDLDYYESADEIYNYMWDPDKYLNVWVVVALTPFWDYYNPTTNLPAHATELDILEGVDLELVNEGDPVPYTTPEEIGLIMWPNDFAEMSMFCYLLGHHYGLFRTEYTRWGGIWVNEDADYCSDTYSYYYRYPYANKQHYPDGWWYLSTNMMDDENSEATVITVQQAQRMQDAIKYCPLRQHLK